MTNNTDPVRAHEPMTGELLPCPFCGHMDQDRWPCEWLDSSGANVIRCAWCHGAAPADVWNRRALASAPPSATVGVDDVLTRALADAYAHGQKHAPFPFVDCERQVRAALTQKPAAPSGDTVLCPTCGAPAVETRSPARSSWEAEGSDDEVVGFRYVVPSGEAMGPDRCAECRHTTFEQRHDGSAICVHCKRIYAAPQQPATVGVDLSKIQRYCWSSRGWEPDPKGPLVQFKDLEALAQQQGGAE